MWDPFAIAIEVKERHRAYLALAAHERVLRSVRRHWAPRRRLDQRVARWLGSRLLRWAAVLEAYATDAGAGIRLFTVAGPPSPS